MIVPVATFENYTGVFGDPLAESYLTAAQEKVEKYLGYTLEAADYETTVKGHGRDYVRLAAAPINSVESVTVGGGRTRFLPIRHKRLFVHLGRFRFCR